MEVFQFCFLLGVDLCTIDSILLAGALVLVVWWAWAVCAGFWGYFSFDLAFVFVLFMCFSLLFPFLLLIRWLLEKSSNLFDNL